LAHGILSSESQITLVERIAAGDPSAEEELARLFSDSVIVMATVRLRDREAARDVAQEVMIAVLSALRAGQLREPDRLAAFVYGVARNLIHRCIRTRRLRALEEPLAPEHAVIDPPDIADMRQQLALVREALGRLDEVDRRILMLSFVSGLKPGEIGERLGCAAEWVRTRKSRAYRKMRAIVDRLSRTAPSTALSHDES